MKGQRAATSAQDGAGEVTSQPPRERASAELGAGTRLSRYVLLSRLGRGGMGDVFVAQDPKLDRQVAIKVLRHARGETRLVRVDRARLRREAQTLAQLSHPNVVEIYDVGQWEGHTFIAMELVSGEHLGRFIRREPRAWSEVLPIFFEAGRGLAAAHAAGIVHRDFKPSNVMLGDDGRVCVLDFGLATGGVENSSGSAGGDPEPGDAGPTEVLPADDEGSLTRTGHTIGTPPYMAPEQHLNSQAADARSDQFSFCVSLFEALTRKRPFPGRDVSCLVEAKRSHHILPVPEAATIPPWLWGVIDRGLAARPQDRYPSMDALLEELSCLAPAPSRRRRVAGLGVAVGVGLAVAGGIAWSVRMGSPCEHGPERLAARWDDQRAERLGAAFEATGVPYGTASWHKLRGRIDAYGQAWVEGHRFVCEATHLRREQDEGTLDLRMRCLEARLDALGAAVEVLAEVDARTLPNATWVVGNLPGVERCRGLESGPTILEPPYDPTVAAKVERLRWRLASATALESAGRYRDGLAMTREVEVDAAAVPYPAVQLEARRRLGSLLMMTGDHVAAEQTLAEVAWDAVAAEYDEVAVGAMLDLVHLMGEHFTRPDEAEGWAQHAQAALRRAPDAGAEARLWSVRSVVEVAQGDYAAAQSSATRALELVRGLHGEEHPALVVAHNNLGNALHKGGQSGAAERHYRRALALAEEAYGVEHPRVATLLLNLGGLLAQQGALEPAHVALARALKIRRRSLGLRHPEVGDVLNNLGNVTSERGDRSEAIRLLKEALSIQEDALGSDHVKLAVTRSNLAGMMLSEGELGSAREHAERALALIERAHGGAHPRLVFPLTVLGSIERAGGRPARARARLERALTLVRQSLGEEHPAAIEPLLLLGEVELELGHPEWATPRLRQAHALAQAAGRSEAQLAPLRLTLARARVGAGETRAQVQPLLELARRGADEALRATIDAWSSPPAMTASDGPARTVNP